MCVSECTAGYPCCCNQQCYIRASSTGYTGSAGQKGFTAHTHTQHEQYVFKHWEHEVPVATHAGYKPQQHSQVALKVHPHQLAKFERHLFFLLGLALYLHNFFTLVSFGFFQTDIPQPCTFHALIGQVVKLYFSSFFAQVFLSMFHLYN